MASSDPTRKPRAARDDDGDEGEHDEDDEPQDDAPQEGSRVAAATARKGARAKERERGGGERDSAERPRRRKKRKAGRRREEEAAAPPARLANQKELIVGALVLLGVAVIYFAPQSGGGEGPRKPPAWTTGQSVDVEITLVATDQEDLACASAEDHGGLRCGYTAPNRKFTPPDGQTLDPSKVLQPYTTSDGVELWAVGLWQQQAVANKAKEGVKAGRFRTKCKFEVVGKNQKGNVRWRLKSDDTEPWNSRENIYVGKVSECTI